MASFIKSPAEMYINGSWMPSLSGECFNVLNPATLETIAEVANGGKEEIRMAVNAAHDAFPAWSAVTTMERAKTLHRMADLVMENRDDLAVILTQENGKPLAQAKGEVESVAGLCNWYAEEAMRTNGRVLPIDNPMRRAQVIRQPVGVCALITPFNFPVNLLAGKLAPALAVGCTVVVRPSSATPLTTIALFKVWEKANLPKGVINLVTGSNSSAMGEELATNPLVKKVSFTGSNAVGKELLRHAAGTIKRVTLELGGTGPMIVFADADLDKAADAAALSGFRNSGQVCSRVNRILVDRAVAADFAERLAVRAKRMRFGNGLDSDVDIGPLIDQKGFNKVCALVDDALTKGATAIAGGHPGKSEGLAGYFFEPTVLTNATLDMRIMNEETFGPVLPIMEFDSEDEAIRIANDTPYGLLACYFTHDLGRALRVAERLEYGVVGCNESRPTGLHIPFGGMKESGMGREEGPEGLDGYLENKAVVFAF